MISPRLIPHDVRAHLFTFLKPPDPDELDEQLILAGRWNWLQNSDYRTTVERIFVIRVSLIKNPSFEQVSIIFLQMLEGQPFKFKSTLPSEKHWVPRAGHIYWFKGGEPSLEEEFKRLSPIHQRRVIQGTWNLLQKVNLAAPFEQEYQVKMRNLSKVIFLRPFKQVLSMLDVRDTAIYRDRQTGKVSRICQIFCIIVLNSLLVTVFLACDVIYSVSRIAKIPFKPREQLHKRFDPLSWQEL